MHNTETEESLLCCLINKPENIVKVSKWIEEDDVFYSSFNRDIWRTIKKMDKNGDVIDVVSIIHKFPSKKHGNKEISYTISGIFTKEPTYTQAEHYARLLHEHWLRRKMVVHSHELIKTAEDNSIDLNSLINKLNNDSSNLIGLRPSNNDFDIDEVLNETNDSIFNSRGIIKTGLEKLDTVIHGMTRGEITIIAGRPANGKTTVAANIARQLVLSGKKVIMFNREMPNTEMMKKFIAMESDSLSYKGLRHGTKEAMPEIHRAMDYIKKNYKDKLFMYDAIRDMQETFNEIKRIKPDVVIDDHIGLIEYPSRDNRDLRHKIRETTMRYKWLAKGDDMCVILVSQLNRNIEHRIDATPRLSDLAESGSLEQDAEMVVFTHYPYVSRYGEEDSNGRIWMPNEIMLIVSKNRYGTPGSVEMGYSGDSCKLFNTIIEANEHEKNKNLQIKEEINFA
jgi:replicative DNA helicase